MITSEAPDLTPGYPSKGPRLGPVWKDVWTYLQASPEKWHDAWALADVLAPKYDLEPLSIVQLMSRMATGGILEREKRPVTTTITRTQKGAVTTREGLRLRSHYRINAALDLAEHAARIDRWADERTAWRKVGPS
jgi:hypothetical protein